jgi:hypothetical protein
MPIFMSYSRNDEATVKVLARGFEKVHREVWYDHDLEGGEIWWDAILRQIRAADVFLFVLSDRSLESTACLAELDYARACKREILPVQVGPLTSERSNLLAGLQNIVFRPDDITTAFAVLHEADRAAKRAGPLPAPLPTEPAIPFAYLGEIRRLIEDGNLGNSAQLEVVDKLHRSLGEETDASARTDIVALLKKMLRSPWRTVAAEKAIRYVMLAHEVFEDVIAGRPPREPPIPEDLRDPPGSWSEDEARTEFLTRISELVGEMQEGHARQEARQTGEPVADRPRSPQHPTLFLGIGRGTKDGGDPGAPTAERVHQPDLEAPPVRFAGVGRPATTEDPLEASDATGTPDPEESRSSARETTKTAPETAVEDTPTEPPVAFPAVVTYSRALAIAALVVAVAFAVLVVSVGRDATVAIFALPLGAGLVAAVFSAAAAKRTAKGDAAGARRSSILGIVWGIVSVAIAVVTLAVILNSPMPI